MNHFPRVILNLQDIFQSLSRTGMLKMLGRNVHCSLAMFYSTRGDSLEISSYPHLVHAPQDILTKAYNVDYVFTPVVWRDGI